MKKQIVIVGVAAFVAATAMAQEKGKPRQIVVQREVAGPDGGQGNAVWVGQGDVTTALPPSGHFEFMTVEDLPANRVVKGAPYSAEGISETVQILADGTRITRRNSKKFARDSQGRTREEMTLGALGPWASAGEARRIVHIFDPVAKQMIIVNENDQTVHKLTLPGADAGGAGSVGQRQMVHKVMTGPGAAGAVVGSAGVNMRSEVVKIRRAGSEGVKEESLGRQVMEGVAVDGKRITHTIAAGEIGNDRPILSVTEQWYSPELQVTVRSHTKDPQFGETDYRMSGLQRSEPPASLFEVPAGYTVKEGGPGPVIIERRMEKK
ncbi:MAG: hypothetical protein R2762_27625 [Bryobacteraceae bacterium]